MNHPLSPSTPHNLADGAAKLANNVMDAARPASQALSHGVDEVRANAGPALRELAGSAEDMAMSRLRLARDQALHLRASGMDYARGHPAQTLLLAAALGAGLVLALGWLAGRKR